jgi:outer membrane protein assembly factor BamD (BamD/ComL family)
MVINRKFILILCFCLSSCATFSDSGEYYRKAAACAKAKDYDAAFSYLRAILNNNPDSSYAPKAAFGVAEYYYDKGDHLDATIFFHKYVNAYPEDEGVVFAELIIYKMATAKGSNKNMPFNERYFLETIRKKMFSKPVFIIFKESKKESFSYTSAFGNIYSAFDHVDKMTIKRNEREFFEISP